ncbi:ABC transporter permease [Solwaraspora sp. WMMD1047]|uniref:ABC transporter permease n=1 Tax=Solwaraspora sp. WMMD1047 TaxID=3016102 RepID=UPI002415B789|nr:ABC transporter permease [Solwaraspora sp. WMMD1047]MDG4834293.1 ABC transporter permease [Solwaraspora sp. WMMD1047]
MAALLVTRLGRAVILLFLVSVAVFGLVLLIPGDPAVTIAGEDASPQQLDSIRAELGLDEPLPVQYGQWLSGAVTGDLGTSFHTRVPVTESILARFPATFSLTVAALVVALAIGLSFGLVAAAHRGGWLDRALTVTSTAGIAVPHFWLGMVLILAFALTWTLFPAVGYVPLTDDPVGWLRHITLPAVTLGVAAAAELARHTRSAMAEVLLQDYLRTARAKGVRRRTRMLKHALRNAAVPIVTVLGFQVSLLLGGSVIIERMFGIPGLGSLAIDAVQYNDLPVLQGVVLVSALVVVIVNLLTDVAYGLLNPKVRLA